MYFYQNLIFPTKGSSQSFAQILSTVSMFVDQKNLNIPSST